MNDQKILSPWIKRFLVEYLVSVKNLSRNTQHSYRGTFRQYLIYLAKKISTHIDQLAMEDISAENIKEFLLDLELKQKCCISTRNQRLAAIHAFAQFVGLHSPEHIEWCRQIRLIPFKKTQQPHITYLENYSQWTAIAGCSICRVGYIIES